MIGTMHTVIIQIITTSPELSNRDVVSNPYLENLYRYSPLLINPRSNTYSNRAAITTLSMLAIDTKLNITLAWDGKNNFIIGIKCISCIALIKVHIISIDPPATILNTVDVVKAIAIEDEAAYPITVTPSGICS